MENRAILYARVSTPKQAQKYSLTHQLEQEHAYCTDVGLITVVEFAEDKSGRTLDTRDQLEEACKMLERNQADILVVWNFDRLHRNYVNSVVLRDRIRKAGKHIHYAQSRTISGTTAWQRLPEDMQYMMAEIEWERIRSRTEEGRRGVIENEQRWLGSNRPPYGFLRSGQGKTVRMVIDEWPLLFDETKALFLLKQIYHGEVPSEVLPLLQAGNATAVVVRLIFVWYVFGEPAGVPLSSARIAEKLTALGVPTPSDQSEKPWPNKVRVGIWNRVTVTKMLRNSAYNGVFYHYRYKTVDGKEVRNPNKDELRGVPVPAIVHPELFAAAQAKLDGGKLLASRGAKYDYLLARRITCECGYKIRASPSSAKRENQDGTVKRYTYFYYFCAGRKKSSGLLRPCDMPKIDVDVLDQRVWEWVKQEIGDPAVLERKLREVQNQQQQGYDGQQEALLTLTTHKNEVDQELKKLVTLYAKNDIPERILHELVAEETHKLSLVEREIARLQKQLETPLTDEIIDNLLMFSMAFQAQLTIVEQSFEKMRAVVDGLDVQVEVVRRDGEVWLNLKSVIRPDVISWPLFSSSWTRFPRESSACAISDREYAGVARCRSTV